MKTLFTTLVRPAMAALGILALGGSLQARQPDHLWLGADISGTTQDEARGVYSQDTAGVETENTRLMKQYGLDAVRLRVWVDPRGGWSGQQDVLEMARRAKANDMAIMIDFHYSDWWADPQKQNIPKAWEGMGVDSMATALADHTASTLQMLKDNGIDVKWVQVGNETRNGFLWPVAKLDATFTDSIGMNNVANYVRLSNAGYDAVKSVYPEAEVIIHFDNGFDGPVYNTLLDAMKAEGARWDIIGMSVYPYWAIDGGREPDAASTLRDALANIRALKAKYGTDVMIVETGVDSTKPEEGLEFMNALFDGVINDVDGACTGVFYWAPEIFVTVCPDGTREGYHLGAFANRRPTAIMDSYPRAASLLKAK